MQEKLVLFRTITEDRDIDDQQIVKFINWSKGDVQQALNYYYKHLQKGKIKKGSKPSVNPPRKSEKQIKKLKDEKPREAVQEKQQIQQINNNQDPSVCSSEESMGKSVDVFSVLKKGSIQHKKTHDFIKKVRDIYKLPIKGKPQKQLISNSRSSLPENQGKIPEQFMMVDCLSEVFNSQNIQSFLDRKDTQTRPEKLHNEQSKNKVSNKSNVINIQLSVSQQQKNEQGNQSQSELKDIEFYEYKHVYTNSRPVNENEDKKQQKGESQVSQQQQQQKKQKKQKKKPKNSKKQSKKQKKLSVPKVSLRSQAQKQVQLPRLITQYKSVGNSSNKIQEVRESQETAYSQSLLEREIYVGQYFLKGFCTQRRRFQPTSLGGQVKIVTYIEQPKTKKKNFGKNSQRSMNMRVCWEGRQVGRINDDQVRIIMPLINQNLIRMVFYLHQAPVLADLFKPITLKAKVFIQKKMITEPIVQNFQPQQKDKDRVHQISGLLTKLSLPVLTPPLIKAKSKYIRAEKANDRKKHQSIDHLVNGITEQQIMVQKIQEKNEKQLTRIKTDFNYQAKQKSLLDMIKKNQENLKERTIRDEEKNQVNQQGQVKKKIIEIDSQGQKNKLTQLIDLHEQNCEPFYPQKNFKSQLYQYQALALAWMLKRQGFLSNSEDKEELHPLWTEYGIPVNKNYNLFFNQLTGQLCVQRPTAVIKCKGGILADEMGLGKTVMMTALIVSNPPIKQKCDKQLQMGNTLVIVPLTLLSQWQSQIMKHTQNQKVTIYYSSQRKKLLSSLHKYNVVISTYGTISHEYAQGLHNKKAGIYKYKWHRIILDQAHYIKGRIIQTSKAIYELNGNYRWCLTGTPIQNNVTDIFSLLHFIRYTPWSEFACWNRFIVKPMEDDEQDVFQVLRTILKQVFLRRTKSSQGPNGKPIIELPPRVSKVEVLTMSQKQRQFYNSIYTSSRSDFDQLIEKGILQAKYMQVLEMLMRLRQICCHPVLFKSVTKFSKNTEQFQKQLRKLIQRSQKRRAASQSQSQDEYYEPIIDADNQEHQVKVNSNSLNEQYLKQVLEKVASQSLDCCTICLQQPEDPVITCCLHIFCKGCNVRQIQQNHSCSFCRKSLTKQDFIYLPKQNRLNIKKDKSKEPIFLSTKMIALNQHLSKLKIDDKVVIFSQFLGMLDLLEDELKKHNFNYVRMQGSNSHKQRTKIVKSFQQDPQIKIFLVSLKTAGVGLNLVAANKVFLMDPWWNPAVEQQAIERVHRIGQKRSVQIVRFIMDRTIQTRMLQLNTQKKALSQNVINQSQQKDGNFKQKIEKLKYLMQNY